MTTASTDQLSAQVGENLPFLRRYARALTGSQERGDTYAIVALETILGDPDCFDKELDAKTALFKVFHSVWSTTGGAMDAADTPLESQAQEHLAALTQGTREALLLHTIEEFPLSGVADIMGISADEARGLIEIAYSEMGRSISGKVLIIEDEAIISTDLEAITGEMGHRVTGVARNAAKAVELAEADRPDLILSDIQLVGDASGIDAVNDILGKIGEVPVIFITAYPERLLTGEGPEPAFLISKPYTVDQVRSAISQAMFFASTETLRA